ncbi:MAG: alpha-galactosidase [Spirochaetes bacterium]|nr:alpha-galactosidase [Spirochaetota bacterium]
MNLKRGTIRYQFGKREYTLSFTPGVAASSRGLQILSEMIHLEHGWRVTVALEPEASLFIKEASLEINYRFTGDDRIYCNGFQSWTESREFYPNEKIKKLPLSSKKFKINCMGDYHFYPYSGGKGRLHSHSYCYIKQKTGDLSFLGSLCEETGYTIFACETKKNRIMIVKDVEGLEISPGRHAIMDIMLTQGPERNILPSYFEELCPGLETRDPATGWTSWYRHYTNISEEIILGNLKSFTQNNIPIDIFQVDDGYQSAVGDWLDIKPSFPNGMKHIADSIRSAGLRPGIWLAPFICEEGSKIIKEHPEWLLMSGGKPVPAGWNPNWSGTFYALDVLNDEFLYHLREVFNTVFNQWGFDLVKLDFLYAAAIEPRQGMTRGTIMSEAMKFMRRCAGDRLILACGVPLPAAFGMADYCRIGSDVAPKWEDHLLSAINYRERVSTANSLASTVGRSHLNGRVFVNDPDAVILRDEDNSLSQDERFTLFMLNNLLGGLLFTSDDVGAYSPELARIYLSLFPFRKKENMTLRVNDLVETTFRIGENSYTAFANLSSHRAKSVLGDGTFFCSTLPEEDRFVAGDTEITLRPHESRCYLSVREEFFSVAGTTAHVFPGSEIISCTQKGEVVKITQHEQVRNRNTVYLRAPNIGQYIINGTAVTARKIWEKLFILQVDI